MAFLEIDGISKSFGAVDALSDVRASCDRGECVALMGGNGAGKSTLIAIISGVLAPDSGEIRIDDERRDLSGAIDARQLGIETVYQNLGLCLNLNAASNLFLGRELTRRVGPMKVVRRSEMEKRARTALRDLGVRIPDPRAAAVGYSGGQRQGLAFARAVYSSARLLLLDEPTAALGMEETRRVRETVKRLRAERGIGVLLVTHDLAEMRALADRVIVLYHGRVASTLRCGDASDDEIVALITGSRTDRELSLGDERPKEAE